MSMKTVTGAKGSEAAYRRATLAALALLAFVGAPATARAQERGGAPARVEVLGRDLAVTLQPDLHELAATATVRLKAAAQTGYVTLTLGDNLFVSRVLDAGGVELEFDQNRAGPETLSIRFSPPLQAGAETTLRIEYEGGYDSDRFSRIFSRDTTSAYIGMEGVQLLEGAKWLPSARFPVERAPGSLSVTVPLGMTVVGPGEPLPVTTQGATETFGWKAEAPLRAGAFVAGDYALKRFPAGEFTVECYSRGGDPDAMGASAEAAGRILAHYRDAYGPLPAGMADAAGGVLRLVEVDDALARQSGMAGTVFVTRRELAGATPPVVALARRIAAQWWNEAAGGAAAGDFWLADGLSYYSAARYLGATEGSDAFRREADALAVLALKFEDKGSVRDALGLGYRSEQFESVAAGKGAWILNMLQGIMGEEKFARLLKDYYAAASRAGASGGAALFQRLAGDIHGKDLGWFFTEWLDTIGVPTLESDYVLYRTAEGFRITGSVKQGQDLFRMPVEIAVVTSAPPASANAAAASAASAAGQGAGAEGAQAPDAGSGGDAGGGAKEELRTVELVGKSTSFDISTFAMPQRIVLDPRGKILRDSRELRTSVKLALGDDLRQAGNLVEAIRAYDEALKLSPRRSLAHYRLGQAFFEQYNLQSAANAFRDALNGDKDPQWVEVWCYIHLGKIYDILGQRQRALAEYTKAMNTNDGTDGAQMEAARWQATPYVRSRGEGEPPAEAVDATDAADGASEPVDGEAGESGGDGEGAGGAPTSDGAGE
ncbi:MAG: tetratricopeptide repeat protein [Acidobacteriota bacterium]|jgi:tetratricopeptide (TPR) repeat protein|nr:tetratricopeptide repeat protein [Acidobacteriota bacterium]